MSKKYKVVYTEKGKENSSDIIKMRYNGREIEYELGTWTEDTGVVAVLGRMKKYTVIEHEDNKNIDKTTT